MKRLFFSVIALALGTFAFISCDKDDNVDDGKDGRGNKYMTVPEQQQAITNCLDGVAEALDFTELSKAAEVISGIIGRNIGMDELALMFYENPELLEDATLIDKISTAMAMFMGDTIVIDLEPLYMSADLYMTDTLKVATVRTQSEDGTVSTRTDTVYYTKLSLANLSYDVDCVQLNVFVDGHKITLKANAEAGESTFRVKDDEDDKTIVLPETVKITIDMDGKALASYNGEYKSDMNIFIDGDNLSYQGSKLSTNGKLIVTGYELEGNYSLDLKTGMAGKLIAKYSGNALLSVDGNISAVFEGLDLNDEAEVLAWAQDPEKLKSISLNASLAGGKVEFKGTMENPFKDEELAKILRTLMVPNATITKDKAELAIEKLNGIINAGFYFEGYKNAQAELKLIYREAPTGGKDGGNGAIDAAGELLDDINAYPVLVAHDEKGNEVEVSFEEYFAGVNPSNFAQIVSGKFMEAFGPLLSELQEKEEEIAQKIK